MPGTLSFGLAGSMASYLGWIFPYDSELILISDKAADIQMAQLELARIGIDHPAGSYVGDFSGFLKLDQTRTVTFKELILAIEEGDITILDVRSLSERAASHIEPSINIPLHELANRIAEIPRDSQIWVHCASAYRATIAIGLLAKSGINAVLIAEPYEACLKVAGLKIVSGNYDSGFSKLTAH